MSQLFSLQTFIFVAILIIYILASHFIEGKKVSFIHQSGIGIMLGFLTAILVKNISNQPIEFNNNIFFSIILPPIIFSAGYSLRKSLFFQSLGIISFLGIAGTIIAFILLTLVLTLLDRLIFNALTLKEIMMLSSLLCATDTVAAMSLIKPEKYPTLNAILFGEGILNDAVSIILFKTASDLNLQDSDSLTIYVVLKMVGSFLFLLLISIAIGVAAGFGLSYLLKISETFIRSPIRETSLILLTGYATYLIGEILDFSGIISLFTCAIIMGHYAFMNISDEAQKGTGLAFQTLSYIAQAFIYAYMGASSLIIGGETSAVGFAFLILPFFLIVRYLVVYTLPLIYKLIRREFQLKKSQLKMCWYSGLVRGVIAFALCLQIQTQDKVFIKSACLVIVMFTTLVGASLLKPFAKCIGIDEDEQPDLQFNNKINDNLMSKSNYNDFGDKIQNIGNETQEPKDSLKTNFKNFENNYLLPFVKKNKPDAFNYATQPRLEMTGMENMGSMNQSKSRKQLALDEKEKNQSKETTAGHGFNDQID